MLNYLVPAVFCSLALLSACEPKAHESLDPDEDKPITSTNPGTEKDDDPQLETDSIIILALAEVNAVRENGCNCGDQSMPSTSKLSWNTKLYEAASAHAKDMHANNYFSHTSKNGDNLYQRLAAADYITTHTDVITYGENIAFGNFDLKAAIQKWLASQSHCANLMRETYREMAIAQSGNYWVQVFGAKRE
ncbi:CAP domain-containing protein [Parapedobacter tibetensis]|uniref:CAP domain-containing protein n=1 Tax=Parapedobacter tibetensis TaxID=2972951 RepID=UPI00214D593B|nr:CAP domain-containing protein [Parapedobacter tibetensis]